MRKRKPIFPELEKQILVKGIKKKDIAKALSISPHTLSLKLTGCTEFTLKEVKAFHEMFPDVSVEQLFSL